MSPLSCQLTKGFIMNKMNFCVGLIGPYANVEVTNKIDRVEVKIINGNATEKEVRRSVGNYGKRMWDFDFSGHYSDRKEAAKRLEYAIEDKKLELEALEFALKVTKKKNWVMVER